MKLPIISPVKTHILASTNLFMGLVDLMVVARNHYNAMDCCAMWCWNIGSFSIWILFNHSFQVRRRTQLSKYWVVSVPKQSHYWPWWPCWSFLNCFLSTVFVAWQFIHTTMMDLSPLPYLSHLDIISFLHIVLVIKNGIFKDNI